MAVNRPKPVYPSLVALRDLLSTIAGVKTCKIGLESGLSPDDYPIIRLVPSKLTGKGMAQQVQFSVYYGAAITESDGGLEAVYESPTVSETEFVLTAQKRIADYQQQEADKLEAERERIKQQERAKLEAEQARIKQQEAENLEAERELIKQQEQAALSAEQAKQAVGITRPATPMEVTPPTVLYKQPETKPRPTNSDIINLVANHYQVDFNTAWAWLSAMRISA